MGFYELVRNMFGICCHLLGMMTFCWILPAWSLLHLFIVYMSDLELCSALDYQSTLDPKFLNTPSNVTYSRGDLAILYCSVENLGTKFVVWRRTSDPNPLTIGTTVFVSDPRYSVNKIDYRYQWNLYIKNVSMSDAGLYECQVSSRYRNIRRVILLKIIDLPTTTVRPTEKPVMTLTARKTIVQIGSTILLNCNATVLNKSKKYTTEGVDWYKNGIRIVTTKNTNIHITNYVFKNENQKVSVLEIPNAKAEDAGMYTCQMSDDNKQRIKIDVLSGIKTKNKTNKRGTEKTEVPRQVNSRAARYDSSFIYLLFNVLLIQLR